jgi:hypothetical protein
VKGAEERRVVDRIATESDEVLQSELPGRIDRQQSGCAEPDHFVPQGPERVETKCLVARGVRDDVGLQSVGVREVVVERIEQQGLDEAARRDRPTGMARARHVVVEHGAERAAGGVEP